MFALLPDHAVEFAEIAQQVAARKGCEMSADREVARVTAFAQGKRERQRIGRLPLKRQRQPNQQGWLGCVEDRPDGGFELVFSAERDDLRRIACGGQRTREVAQGEILFDLWADEGNPGHASSNGE